MVEKSGVEKFLLALGLKSSWLKSLRLKLGVKKSRVEMSFNLPVASIGKLAFIGKLPTEA